MRLKINYKETRRYQLDRAHNSVNIPPNHLNTELLKRVSLYASRIHQRYLSTIKGAPEPMDLVQDAVTAYLTGDRKIPEHIPLLQGLCGIITSKASHLRSRAYNARRELTNDLEFHSIDDHHDSLLQYTELRESLLRELGDDEELIRIIYMLWEDPDRKPRDLADITQQPIEKVYNDLRRLRYRLQGVREAFEK